MQRKLPVPVKETSADQKPLTVLGNHTGQCWILVRLEVLRLGLLAAGHAAGVGAGDAAAVALRDVSAFCRYISEERMNQHTRKKFAQQSGSAERGLGNLKLAGVDAVAAVAVSWIAHVGIIIMIVNNASRLMAPCEGGEDWLESSGRALDMVMRDGLSN